MIHSRLTIWTPTLLGMVMDAGRAGGLGFDHGRRAARVDSVRVVPGELLIWLSVARTPFQTEPRSRLHPFENGSSRLQPG